MYFLKQCLEQIDGVESVYFVYWRNDKSSISDNMRLDLMDIDIYDSDEVIDKTDVLIEGTLTLEPQIEAEYHKRGAKIVSYRMGNDFIPIWKRWFTINLVPVLSTVRNMMLYG